MSLPAFEDVIETVLGVYGERARYARDRDRRALWQRGEAGVTRRRTLMLCQSQSTKVNLIILKFSEDFAFR